MKILSLVSTIFSSLFFLAGILMTFMPHDLSDVEVGAILMIVFGFYLVFSLLVYDRFSGK
jgi:hypothetical protein